MRGPIILITGHGDVDMAVTAIKNGAFDFIEKPFDEARLLASIHRAVERGRQSEDAAAELETLQSRVQRTFTTAAPSHGACGGRAFKQGNRHPTEDQPKDRRKSSVVGDGAHGRPQPGRLDPHGDEDRGA